MTRNQIAYWQLQEDKRANYAREDENRRSNLAKEDLTGFQNQTNLTQVQQGYDLGLRNLGQTKARDDTTREVNLMHEGLHANEVALQASEVGIKARQADISAIMAKSSQTQAAASIMQGKAAITNSLANTYQAETAADRQSSYASSVRNQNEYNFVQSMVNQQTADARSKEADTGRFNAIAGNILRGLELVPKFVNVLSKP